MKYFWGIHHRLMIELILDYKGREVPIFTHQAFPMPNILPFNMHSDSSSDSRLDDAGNFECQCDVVFTYLMVD